MYGFTGLGLSEGWIAHSFVQGVCGLCIAVGRGGEIDAAGAEEGAQVFYGEMEFWIGGRDDEEVGLPTIPFTVTPYEDLL